ncbi:MAG: DNA polymerase III subunit gamma/tau [Fibrobacter sp.]|jgi:DNA polymerase-3 subunit gamma/tau|nr:DNA polymerase III subunit gamma/tau [Fibrobacter sp.]
MAYIAMARKWRPHSFQSMVGQDHIAKTLQNAIEGGRLHHAFLFTGTRGVGKTTSARILAKTLNCTGPNPIVPCGECASCKDIGGGTPMDVLEIDAASNTGVDNIRELIERVQYTPMIGKYKVFIIDEVHMLSNGAFNALLKTLEEPPSHVIFIFATTEVNKVPQTILSRVQRFDFKRLTASQIVGRLEFICKEEGVQVDPEALQIFAEKADGSMRDALTYFDQAYAFTGTSMNADAVRSILGIPPNELYFKLIESFENHHIKGAFEMVEEASAIGVEFTPLLDGFSKFLRNLLYSRLSVSAEELGVSVDFFSQLQSTGEKLSNGDLLRLSKMLSDLQAKLSRAQNPRLLVETTFARMAWLDHLTDLKRALSSMAKIEPASNEVLKKKVVEVSEFIELETQEKNSSWTSTGAKYSRYELSSAWNAICRDLSSDEDILFAATLNKTNLHTPDLESSPFIVQLQFKMDNTNESSWAHMQFSQNPHFHERLSQILAELLQCPVSLQVEKRELTSEEQDEIIQNSKSPYEKDFESLPILGLLQKMYDTELIYSKRIPKVFDSTTDIDPIL